MNPNGAWFGQDMIDPRFGLGGGFGDPWTPPIDLGGGGSGDPGGGWWGIADDLLEDLGVYDWIGNLINPGSGGGEVSETSRQQALALIEKNPSTIQSFLSFLQDLGVYGTILAQMVSGSILQWPTLIQDAMLYWASKNRPGAYTEDGKFIGDSFLVDYRDPNPSPIGPPIPTPGGGLPVVGGGTYGPFGTPVIQATPTQVYKARKGYVIVRDPETGARYEMIKELAYKLGLAKRRKKAPITATQYAAIKAAKRWESKLSRMLTDSCNYKVTKKR